MVIERYNIDDEDDEADLPTFKRWWDTYPSTEVTCT